MENKMKFYQLEIKIKKSVFKKLKETQMRIYLNEGTG